MTDGAQGYGVHLLAWVVLHFTWQGAFLFLSWQICDRLMRAAAPEARYRAAWLHLNALGAAPLLTLLISHRAILASMPAGGGAASPGWAQGFSRPAGLVWPLFHFLGRALPGLLAIWAGGALAGTAFLLAASARPWRLFPAQPVSAELLSVVDEISGKLGLREPPQVLRAHVASPFVHGARRPRLVLPCEIERLLTPAELQAVVAHELVHLKRSDYASNLHLSALLALLWLHPAAWYLWSRTRREREACCDALAVQLCGAAAPLARGLFRLAAGTNAFSASALAAAAGPLERRLQRLLEPHRPSAPLASRAAALPALGALALATILFARLLPADREVRQAFIASRWSPVVTIHAHDPAGSFEVQMHQGQVLAISLGREAVPPGRVVQHGDVVRVLGPTGREVLCLTVVAGRGIRWEARRAGSSTAL